MHPDIWPCSMPRKDGPLLKQSGQHQDGQMHNEAVAAICRCGYGTFSRAVYYPAMQYGISSEASKAWGSLTQQPALYLEMQ
eukprot:1160412-Pelagomonas_calceolata.AAC.18